MHAPHLSRPSVRASLTAVALAGVLGIPGIPLPSAQAATSRLLCNVAVPMDDGTLLSANVSLPARPGRYPAILSVTPYGKNGATPPAVTAATGGGGCSDPSAGEPDLTSNGYVRIVVDERGTGNSQGTGDLSGPSIVRDAQDLLDWIQAQPWSNGKVGNIGCSALGMSAESTLQGEQVRLAQGKKKAIYATWADSPPGGDQYRDVSYGPGGAGSGAISLAAPAIIYEGTSGNDPTDASQRQALQDQAGGGLQYVDFARDFQADGPLAYYGQFWKDRAFDPHAESVRTPVMLTAAASDLVSIQRGALATFMALKNASKRMLVYSPGYHCGPTHLDTLYGGRNALVKKWFDHYLKGSRNGIDQLPDVNLFPTNGSSWWHADAFPIRGTRYTSYYLSSTASGTSQSLNDGSLSTSRPRAPGRESTPYVPLNAACGSAFNANGPGIGGQELPLCASDNRVAEATSLTYTSPALASPQRLAGLITADLWATFNRSDGSIAATLAVVHPDGTSQALETGVLRASNRAVDRRRSVYGGQGLIVRPFHPDTSDAAQPVRSGFVERYLVEINPTAALLAKGDRLRLVVSVTDAGTLPSATQLSKMAGETMWIAHGPANPSRLVVPLVPAAAFGH